MDRMKKLVEKLNNYNYNYYVLDKPIISDKEWDKLYDELLLLEKESGIILEDSPSKKVGGEVLKGFNKVEHKEKLYSLEKVNNFEDLKDWLLDIKKKVNNAEFNVIIIDNERIHEMNREYRGVDRETDVITFALEDHTDIEFEDLRLLGDVYISIEKARSQAIEYGHSLKRELSFLTIHGLLHLLGYDHMDEDSEKEMFKLQDAILDSYGIKRD